MEWNSTRAELSMNRRPTTPHTSAVPASPNTVWADATPLLQAACTDLRDGELIHGDNFNLFAAMSALEIMDPKMDSGMICKYYSVEEAIEDGVAPIPISFDRTTDVQCTIDVMDHLLACEATWHKGHSLAQTVFSCIYLLSPERTASSPILHSYCKIVRSTCKAVISVVSDARTHEEEDLFTMAYGLPLDGDADEKSLSLLHAVEENLCRQVRACKAQSSKRKGLEDMEPLQSDIDMEESYCKALLCRLRFRKHFFHVLACMKRPQGKGLELARKHIASSTSELETIRKSADFIIATASRSCSNGIEDRTTASGRQAIGFDASLNSRVSAPAPPRSIKMLSWSKAIEYFEKLLHDLDFICSYSLDPSLEVLLRFVAQFQSSQPDLVARSHLQLLLVQEGRLYGRDPMFSVITRAGGLPETTKHNDIQRNESVMQLGQLVINMLKIVCTNSAWQRRKLGKSLQDWRVIYVQLELAFRNEFGEVSTTSNDEKITEKIIKHILIWVEEQTYWIAYRFLILGFELELYSPCEYFMVYWYLYAVLVKLAEKTHFRIAMMEATGFLSAKRKGKKRKDSPKDLGRETRVPPAVLFLQCQICLAEGLTLLLAALRNEMADLQSPTPFNSEQEIFLQHFELLQKACVPEHITYHSLKESTSYAGFSNIASHNYFKDAQKLVKEIKSNFVNDPDRLAELRRLEQVAEHNGVAMNVMCKLGPVDPSLKVSFEFIHHPCFATAVVRRA
ncbi:N-alpha-acetyltransferase 35, NatC auxiliary subunit [Linum perenne]